MRARVWGCRGSLAAPGPDTVRYGGNTSCVQVELESGHQLVLDAGTGMRPLGVAMNRTDGREIHILLTHLHLDHLQGLGFFRRHRCSHSKRASRLTCRRPCSRSISPIFRPTSCSTTNRSTSRSDRR